MSKNVSIEEVLGEVEDCSKQDMEWVKLLVKYGDLSEFMSVKAKSINIPMAIMKYRKMLKDKGVGDISFFYLKEVYTNHEQVRLHNLLECMFLEPLTQKQFDYVLDKTNAVEGGIEKLYYKHKEDKNKRILNTTLIIQGENSRF